MNWIKALFGRSPNTKNQRHRGRSNLRFEPGGLEPMGDIPRYPPFTKGLPAASPEALLNTQKSLIRQLKHELALTPQQNKVLVDPLLLSYASFVHLLPASKAHHHRGAGGMLRHGLEVALWSTRGFHGRIIDGHESGERRKILEPRWRLAVAVAGLCHDIGKTAYDVVVADETGRKVWDVYGGLLTEWIEEEKLDRYFISWRSGREHKVHERFGHLLTMRVIPRQVLSYLNEADPRIIAVMHETIAGQVPSGQARVVHELVMAADQRSVQRDTKGQRVGDSDSALGVPVAKYLVDAMKRLIDQGTWQANQENQPLWVTGSGVYLNWDQAVPQIIDLLLADGVSGIPRSQNSVAESLSDFDIIKKQITSDGEESYYLPVAPEKQCSKKKVYQFKAVELTALDILFDGPHPAPVDVHVGVGAIKAREALNEKRDKKLAEDRNDRALKRHDEKLAQSDGESRPVMPDTPAEPCSHDTDTAGLPDAKTPSQAPLEAPSLPVPEEADLKALAQKSGQADPPPEEVSSWMDDLSDDQRDIIESCFVPGRSEHAFLVSNEVIVRYPAGLACYGEDRNSKLEAIKELLKQNPTFPDKPTHKRTINGKNVNVLVLAGKGAEAVQRLEPSSKNKKSVTKTASSERGEAPGNPKQPKTQSSPKDKTQAQTPPDAEKQPIKTKAQKPKPQTPKKAKPKSKPPAQNPSSSASSENPIIVEIKELVLTDYLGKKIEDGEIGGYWISAPEAAEWYVQNVRPDLGLSPVMTALYKHNQFNEKAPPNGDQDYVFLKSNR